MEHDIVKNGLIAVLVGVGLVACGATPEDAGAPAEQDEISAAELAEGTFEDVEPKARFASSSGCSGSQILTVLSAEILAHEYLDQLLEDGPTLVFSPSTAAAQTLQNSFNARTEDDRLYVFATYGLVSVLLNDTDYVCLEASHPDCTVNGEPANARTKFTGSKEVRLCPPYFEQGERGRAQTLIHELTHQDRSSPDRTSTTDAGAISLHNAHSYSNYAPRCAEGNCL